MLNFPSTDYGHIYEENSPASIFSSSPFAKKIFVFIYAFMLNFLFYVSVFMVFNFHFNFNIAVDCTLSIFFLNKLKCETMKIRFRLPAFSCHLLTLHGPIWYYQTIYYRRLLPEKKENIR